MVQQRIPASTRSRPRRQQRHHNLSAVRQKIVPAANATKIRSLLIYARNKVGKTTLCASASELAKTLIIDCEEGSSSISKSKADVYKLTDFEEIDEIYWYLATQKHNYRFVAIDPVSRLGQLCMAHVLRDRAAQDLAADPYTPRQQDWGTTAELMRNVLGKYKALPNMFTIVTAYERRRGNDDEEGDFDYVIGPDAQPAVKGFLMGQMDIIGRLYIKVINEEDSTDNKIQIERRLLTGPHEIYESGDRSGNLPRIMREPTMERILNRVNGRRA